MTATQPIDLRVENLTKAFFGVRAIDSVNLHLFGGEIHGLLGENGAGKSTLCSILSGLYRPDHGQITIRGEPVQLRSPQEASQHGIGMVYQHFRLVDSFTVTQNIALGLGKKFGGRAIAQVEARVAAVAEEYGLHVDPTAAVWQLSVGEQQRVAILKQLFRGAEILILDEPTAVLAPQEADRLFEAVHAITAKGHAVVLVSHKMNEILEHTDRLTVLRRGINAGDAVTADTTPAEVAKMMFGDRYAADYRPVEAQAAPTVGEPVLHVSGLTVTGDRGLLAVDDVSFSVRRGEIVGVAGVAGNGQRELQEAIAGLRGQVSGTIIVGETDCSTAGPKARSNAGLAYVPEDRLGTGLAPGLTLEHNMVLKSYDQAPHSKGGVLSVSNIKATTNALVADFDVRGARDGMPVSLMSGGNLQKTILARELTQPHDVLVAAAPTRGLDMSAADAVRLHILAERDEGRGVLLFSEDLEEILHLSDMVMVMFHGRIVGSFSRDDLDIDEVGLLMTGADRLAS
jgi:ABC-type uncharacterized transport system ATPase subunit